MLSPIRRFPGSSIILGVLCLSAIFVHSAGCERPEGLDAPPSQSELEARRPIDILLISVDCMRADHVGAYGYHRETTPAIDAIAAQGIRFEHAYAQSNWTKPSVASLMTGLYVRHHGVVVGSDHFDETGRHNVKGQSFPLPEDLPLMSESFQDLGYRTAGFVENSHLVPAQGFARGFDEYAHVKPAAFAMGEWISALSPDDRFFGYVHLIGPHDPYDRADEGIFDARYRDRFGRFDSEVDFSKLDYKKTKNRKRLTESDIEQGKAYYDAELLYYDQEFIAPLIATLEKAGRFDSTLLVVTADHGEELMDHGRWSHGETLYEGVVRVPLVIKMPAHLQSRPAGSVITEVSEQIGLFPTLCEIAGCVLPEELDGRSFASVLVGEREEDPDAIAISEFAKGVRQHVLGAAAISRQGKWVESYPSEYGPRLLGPMERRSDMNPKPYLLDPRTDETLGRLDPEERHPLQQRLLDVFGTSPDITHVLVDSVGYTETEMEELKALGYVE